MKTNKERIEKNKVQLEIEVPAGELEKAMEKSYRKIVPKLNIPGFRKGKVPRKVVEMYVGKEALLQEALEELIPDTYSRVVEQDDIEPIDHPQFDIIQAEVGKDLIYKAVVEVKPEIELGQYKGIEIIKEELQITDEDVNRELANLQQGGAKTVPVEDGVLEQGRVGMIDFEGFIDGEPFEGGKGEDYRLTIGSGTFIPGFEDQLVGVKVGEEKEVNVTFPETYHSENLAGKDAMFKVVVRDVLETKLPELNDEFAKTIADVETLEELKVDIKNKLEEREQEFSVQRLRQQAIDKVLETTEIEAPDAMIESAIDQRMKDLNQRLEMDGLNLETYLEVTQSTEEKLREEFRQDSEKVVKVQLILDAVAKQEELEVEQSDVDGEVARIAQSYNITEDVVRNILTNDEHRKTMYEGITREKAADFLVKNAEIKTA